MPKLSKKDALAVETKRARKSMKRVPRMPEQTPEQLERFERDRRVELTLRFKHTINGVQYGPGRVGLPNGLVATLLEQESRAEEEVERFRGTRSAIIGAGNRVIMMAPELIETAVAGMAADPYATLRG